LIEQAHVVPARDLSDLPRRKAAPSHRLHHKRKDSGGWLMCRRSAARLKFSYSATVTK
jgi:hypothetical protein